MTAVDTIMRLLDDHPKLQAAYRTLDPYEVKRLEVEIENEIWDPEEIRSLGRQLASAEEHAAADRQDRNAARNELADLRSCMRDVLKMDNVKDIHEQIEEALA